MTETTTQQDAIARVIDSARHLGVEIDETEADACASDPGWSHPQMSAR